MKSDLSTIELLLQASLRAIEDAGLTPKDIDGIIPGYPPNPPVEEYLNNLGIKDLNFTTTHTTAGSSPVACLQSAPFRPVIMLQRYALIAQRHMYEYGTTSRHLGAVGFCKKGEGCPFVEGGRIELGGQLPIDTCGGNMSQAYIGGTNHIVEAVKQLRGTASRTQVKDAEIGVVTGLGGEGVGSIVILRK